MNYVLVFLPLPAGTPSTWTRALSSKYSHHSNALGYITLSALRLPIVSGSTSVHALFIRSSQTFTFFSHLSLSERCAPLARPRLLCVWLCCCLFVKYIAPLQILWQGICISSFRSLMQHPLRRSVSPAPIGFPHESFLYHGALCCFCTQRALRRRQH